AACSESVTGREITLVQFLKIVDFAIKRDPDGSVLVRERLMAALHINNGQPAERQPDARSAVVAFVVRPAMVNGVGHTLKGGAVNRCFTPGFERSEERRVG